MESSRHEGMHGDNKRLSVMARSRFGEQQIAEES
jgi:hypothetical protein